MTRMTQEVRELAERELALLRRLVEVLEEEQESCQRGAARMLVSSIVNVGAGLPPDMPAVLTMSFVPDYAVLEKRIELAILTASAAVLRKHGASENVIVGVAQIIERRGKELVSEMVARLAQDDAAETAPANGGGPLTANA